MLAQIRRALAAVGGLQVVAATIAIGWGLTTLAKVAEERQELLDALAMEQLEREAAIRRHPAGSGVPCDGADYPAAEDTDPLGRADELAEADRG